MSDLEHASPVLKGDILAGKYRVDNVLGVGGMGIVVAATHIELDQRVALKFLLPVALRNRGALERFAREGRLAVKLRSDHVTRVLDVGALETGAPYMVMELLEGDDLDDVLKSKRRLPIGDAVEYVLQACDAVAEAHALGIVHRDLKPRNLFLTRKLNGAPHIKVLDFGISKMPTPEGDHSLTKTNEVMGSPNYMAPEQLRASKDVDGRTDIWALGVILYELVTGRVPFLAETITQLCSLVLEKDPPPIEQLCQEVPHDLAHVIHKCLAKDPRARFSNVSELIAALMPFTSSYTTNPAARFNSDPGMALNPLARSASMPRALTAPNTGVTWGETVGADASQKVAPPARSTVGPIAAVLSLCVVLGAGGLGVRYALHARSAGKPSAPVVPTPAPTASAPQVDAPLPSVRKDAPIDVPPAAVILDAAPAPAPEIKHPHAPSPPPSDVPKKPVVAASAAAAPSAKPPSNDFLPGDRK